MRSRTAIHRVTADTGPPRTHRASSRKPRYMCRTSCNPACTSSRWSTYMFFSGRGSVSFWPSPGCCAPYGNPNTKSRRWSILLYHPVSSGPGGAGSDARSGRRFGRPSISGSTGLFGVLPPSTDTWSSLFSTYRSNNGPSFEQSECLRVAIATGCVSLAAEPENRQGPVVADLTFFHLTFSL